MGDQTGNRGGIGVPGEVATRTRTCCKTSYEVKPGLHGVISGLQVCSASTLGKAGR